MSLSKGIYISSYKQKKGFCQNKRKILGTSIKFIFWLCGLPSVGFHITIFFQKNPKPAVKFLCISFLFTVASEQEVVIPVPPPHPPAPQVPRSCALKANFFFFLFPLCWYNRHLFLATGFVGLWSLAVNLG